MSYQEDVEAAAAALVRGDEANWKLARLTWENTNSQTDRTKTTMAIWTADVRRISGRKFSETTGAYYRAMWNTNRTFHQSGKLSWTDSWNAIKPHDEAEPMRARAAQKHLEEATPSEAAKTIKKALDRPEVARQVVADREANIALAKARQEHDAESRAVHEARDPELRDGRISSELASIKHELARMRNLGFTSVSKATDWTNDSDELVELIDELIAAWQAVRDALDFDAQLAHMIEGEN